MKGSSILKAWGCILSGRYPVLSLEITRECPLHCPGCYAYEPEHLHQLGPLRSLSDYKGQQLIDGVLALVRRYRPIHISIVGGEPLVRYRELDVLIPRLSKMGIAVQLVTSAVREIPKAWAQVKGLQLVVSVDGLQPEHDIRRTPATYDRILKSIAGHQIIVHCTITRQMVGRSGYFEEFLSFWSDRPEVAHIWLSLFTPQIGAEEAEVIPPGEREEMLTELAGIRHRFPKLLLPNSVIQGYRRPPRSPDQCLFARTTLSLTADLKGRITPCQFGGNPDCTQCGCIASAGLNAVGDHRLLGVLSLRSILNVSAEIGKATGKILGNPN